MVNLYDGHRFTFLVGKDHAKHHKENPAVDSQAYRELNVTVNREDTWTTVQRKSIMAPALLPPSHVMLNQAKFN